MGKPTYKPDDPEQSARFLKMAEELEATGDAKAFDRAFRKVATAERQAATPKKPKRKKR